MENEGHKALLSRTVGVPFRSSDPPSVTKHLSEGVEMGVGGTLLN